MNEGQQDAEHDDGTDEGHRPTAAGGSGRPRRHPGERPGWGRFLGLTVLGTLVPGAGLLGTRARRVGALVLLLFLLGAGFLLWRTRAGGLVHTVLDLAVRPRALLAIGVGVVAVALVWIATIVLTAWLTEPRTGRRSTVLARGFAALMCVLVALPAVEAVRYVAIQRSVVGTVFHPSSSYTTGSNDPTAGSPDQDPWEDVDRVNVLLLGSDAGTDRTGTRTDSMIVASVDPHTGDTVLIGVPRNLENIPIPKKNPLHRLYPNGYDCGDQCLMNSIWTLATDHKDLFPNDPNPGLTSTRQVLESVLGIGIDHTVIIDLSGFQSLVDAMGGVDINAKERVPIGGHVENGQISGITGWIDAGPQHMDGFHALWYARSRATTDDFSRMRRQRCVTAALLNQVNPVSMLRRYPDLADVAKKHVSVDIPQEDLPAWVDLVERIQKGSISALTFTNRVIDVTNPDYAKIHRLVRRATTDHPSSSTSSSSPSSGSATSTSTPSPSSTPSEPTDTFASLSSAC